MAHVVALALLAAALVLPPPSVEGHWEGAATHEGKSFRLRLDVARRDGKLVAYVDYVDYVLYAIPFEIAVEGERVHLDRHAANGVVTKLEGRVDGETLAGSFTGAGVKEAPFRLERTSPKAAVLREIDLPFRNGDVSLGGTLILPDGTGPFPAIVVSHGGNPETRADAGYRGQGVMFARAGVAALVYDKRGTGSSTGDWQVAGIEELAGDALAGLRALRSRKEIDARRIGVAGHSQGGWIAPLAATQSRDVAFVVATSPSGINPMEQSVFHTSNLLRRAGYSEEVVERAAALRNRLYERARKGAWDAKLPADLERASKEPWFEISALPSPPSPELADGTRRLLLFEPAPVWERVQVPVLAIWGAEDIHLPAARSRDIVEASLARGKNADRTLVVLPGLDHNFAVVRAPGAEWDFPRASTEYETATVAWLRRLKIAHRQSR
jgi:pimeloyl-ACP methyl ester carboxylesterase